MMKFIPDRCQSWLYPVRKETLPNNHNKLQGVGLSNGVYKKASCRLCVDACPVENCISFIDSSISIKTENCINCGICTSVCPSNALIMEDLTDRELLNRLYAALPDKYSTLNPISELSLTFGCILGAKEDKNKPSAISLEPSACNINLPCLAILKESHLISLVLSGAKNINLDLSNCNNCSFKHGKTTIEKTISYAENLLNAMGYDDCIKTRVMGHGSGVREDKKSILSFGKNKNKKQNIKTITPGPEYSRRELLSFFREKAVEKAVERVVGKTTKEKGGGKGADGIPERREILLEVLREKGISLSICHSRANGNPDIRIEKGRFPVRQINIDEDCTLCGKCELFCPTGAVTKVEKNADSSDEQGEVRIDFNMPLCMGCYECAELCPENAMHTEDSITLANLLNSETKTLFKKTSQKCPSCNRYFYPEDGMEECLICKKKKNTDDLFFRELFEGQSTQ